ncbi:MAG: NAD(P)/FAD-dependent oxidoreductase [Methanosarcinaceae archaeon]|nr:NAD(P)/FAD-dependent oxidoreductase [Methanosarcinaceae archaeon]
MDADIIVIGASPAGMMAARNAFLKGANVILIDKKARLGHPPHPANTFFKGMFDKTGEKISKEYIIKELKGAHIVAPSGEEVIIETPGYILNRTKFDEYYEKKLRNTGLNLLMGIEAYNVLKTDNIFSVSTSSGVLHSKIVIVSDGINSKIAGLLGLKTMKYPNDIGWAMEADVEANGIGESDMFEYYVGSVAPGWKSTYSPRGGDSATLGVYVRRHGTDVSKFFDAWVEKFKRIKGLDEIKIIQRYVGGDPIVSIPNQIVADGIMITGGAAGHSGIGYSMRAGQICGDVAAEAVEKGDVSAKTLSEYKKQWNREFRTEYYLGRIALETLRKMTDSEINKLMETFKTQDLSFLHGSSFDKAMQVFLFMLKKNPTSLLSYRALFRNK